VATGPSDRVLSHSELDAALAGGGTSVASLSMATSPRTVPGNRVTRPGRCQFLDTDSLIR